MALPKTKRGSQFVEPRVDIQTQVTALLDVLDEDIRHVEDTLVRLDTLRELLIKRDNDALEKLLVETRKQSENYVATELRRQGVRRDLAKELGWTERDLTVTKLLPHVAEPLAGALTERQTRLKALISRLKREHTLTAMLILDCRRFNRSLLDVFLGPAAKTGAVYSPTGSVRPPTGTALLNMQF